MRNSSKNNAQSILPVSVKKNTHLPLLLCASATFVLLQANNAYANPTGADVVAGNVTLSNPSANKLVVNQGSDKAIINWQNFDILNGESTQFVQQSSNSVALNRVKRIDGRTTPTQILGDLSANGKLMIVDQNGVFFGANSRVDVAGLTVSTADTTDSDFLAGKTKLSIAGRPDASIVNKGNITAADGGLVALIAPNVRNDGVIQANMGTVALASAETASVDFYGDNLYSFALDKETSAAANDSESAIENNGIISVGGGKVLLTAKVAKGVVDNVINNTGIIEASSAHLEGGTVVLDGGNGNVSVSGKINASGTKGGNVTVTGENITLASADINASGTNGGGKVKIGGDYQGGGTLAHAKTVTVDTNSKINVSATDSGNGGTSIVWSDEVTDFNGSILGTGGVNGGNGGLAEVSSKGELGYNGAADLHASNGNAGTLLLDPNSLFIGSFSDHFIGTDHFINYAPIVSTLDGGTNVIATALNDVSVLHDIIWSGAGSLTVDAGNNAIIEGDIRASFNGGATQGAININAGNLIQMGSVALSTARGDINTQSTDISLSSSTMTSATGDIVINNSGRFFSDTASVLNGYSVNLNQSDAGSIQNAVDAVGTTTGPDGATLHLGAGNWTEDFHINNSNFNLIGQGIGNTVINAEFPFSHVIFVNNNAHDVDISGLTVNGGTYGVHVGSNKDFKLHDTYIENATGAGLWLDGSQQASITDNVFYNNAVGIKSNDANFTKVVNNSFYRNQTGMDFTGDTNLIVENNYLESNNTGIALTDVNGAIIGSPDNGNYFLYTNYGITAQGGQSIFIDSNRMDYVNYGITATDSLGMTIVDNHLLGGFGGYEEASKISNEYDGDYPYGSGVGSYGIHIVSGGLNTSIQGNEVHHFETGIGVEHSTHTSILSNTVYDIIGHNSEDEFIGGDAIYLNDDTDTLAFDNTVYDAEIGIHSVDSAWTEITGNNVSDTSGGIVAENNSFLSILGNNVHDNSEVGIAVADSDGTKINDNTISNNPVGAVVVSSDNVTLQNNTFNTNGFFGEESTGGFALGFIESNNGTSTGDQFFGNTIGILLDDSQNIFIDEAKMVVPSFAIGIQIQNASGGTLVRNLDITGGDIGVFLDGAGSSMQFSGNNSRFTGQNHYFVLQNNSMFAGGSVAQGDSLDASQQFFEGVRASDFTVEQLAAAEAKTVDVEDGIPTIGNVFYKAFPVAGLNGLDGLTAIREFSPDGLFSYAGQTITNDPNVTPQQFDIPTLNLSLLAPAAGGGATNTSFNPNQLGNLEPAAGGNAPTELASLEPAAGGEPSCGNNFLGSGFNNNFDNATCSIQQQQ